MAPDLPSRLRRRLDPAERFGLRLTLVGLALVLVAVPFSYLLIEVLRRGRLTEYDRTAAVDLQRFAADRPGLTWIVGWLTDLGSVLVLSVVVVAAAVFVRMRNRHRLALFLLVTGAGAGLVNTAVKVLVNRSRPNFDDPLAVALGKSFPSGHAMASTAVYGALLLVLLPALHRRARLIAIPGTIVLVLLIGLSRLLLGVHYVTDVVAGHTLGLAWLAGSTAAFSIWRTERGRQPVHPTEGLEPEAAADLRGD